MSKQEIVCVSRTQSTAATVAVAAGLVAVAAHAIATNRNPRIKGVMSQCADEVFNSETSTVAHAVKTNAETAISQIMEVISRLRTISVK